MNTHPQPPHILVVNASKDLEPLYREVLAEEGYAVSLLPCLPDDLDRLPELGTDLILLDDIWGVSDDRRPTMERLSHHPRTRQLPIVLCTGAVRQVEPLVSDLDATNISIVFKPFDVDHLLSSVSRALRSTYPAMPQRTSGGIFADARD